MDFFDPSKTDLECSGQMLRTWLFSALIFWGVVAIIVFAVKYFG